jgi:hypothetical protein
MNYDFLPFFFAYIKGVIKTVENRRKKYSSLLYALLQMAFYKCIRKNRVDSSQRRQNKVKKVRAHSKHKT